MNNKREEENYLVMADSRISNLEGKVKLLLEQLCVTKEQGDNTAVLVELLAINHDVLTAFREFRSQVLERLRAGGNP